MTTPNHRNKKESTSHRIRLSLKELLKQNTSFQRIKQQQLIQLREKTKRVIHYLFLTIIAILIVCLVFATNMCFNKKISTYYVCYNDNYS